MIATEAVAKKKIWTETELEALPENGFNHEVIDGELVVSPKNNSEHGEVCARLFTALRAFVSQHKLGVIWDSSTGFWMRNRNCRAPDIAFVSKARLIGMKRPAREFIKGAPDLAVEVLSPNSTRREMDERLRDFFESGTQIAWIIDPKLEAVEVCYSLTDRRWIGPGGELDGEKVLPGFRYPIAELFKEWDWD